MSDNPPTVNLLDGMFSAAWLMEQEFDPLTYAVEGIIPEGLTILAGPPKIAKSWLVLDTGVRISVGADALGSIPVQRRRVLYLALEDGKRRLQSRLRTLGVAIGQDTLEFITEVPHSPLETIGSYLAEHGHEKPLIILDTLGKIRGTYAGSDKYQHDYAQASALKALVDAYPGSSIVVVHHTRKGEGSDFVDSVSGTQGLAGAADTIITLSRDRHDGAGILNVTSRDAAEGRYAMTFDNGKWTLDGATLTEAAQAVTNRESVEGIGDDMTRIVETVQDHPGGITRKRIIDSCGLSAAKVDVYLKRAVDAGRITRSGRGSYTPVSYVRSVRFKEDPDDPKLTHLTHLTGGQKVTGTPEGGDDDAG